MVITRFCPVNSRVPNLNLKVPKRQQCMGFTRHFSWEKKTTPTQSSCFFIHSSWAEVQSCTAFATTILCFMKPWPFGWRKGWESSGWVRGNYRGTSTWTAHVAVLLPTKYDSLSHEWCFLGRKAWVNHTQQHLENVTSLWRSVECDKFHCASWCSDTQRLRITSKISSFQADWGLHSPL